MQAAVMKKVIKKNALPVAAFVKNPGQVLADVRTHGRKFVVENDRPVFVVQTAEEYEKIMDMIEDMRVEQMAAERLAKSGGEGTSFESAMAEFGLTEENLQGWEDVEIE